MTSGKSLYLFVLRNHTAPTWQDEMGCHLYLSLAQSWHTVSAPQTSTAITISYYHTLPSRAWEMVGGYTITKHHPYMNPVLNILQMSSLFLLPPLQPRGVGVVGHVCVGRGSTFSRSQRGYMEEWETIVGSWWGVGGGRALMPAVMDKYTFQHPPRGKPMSAPLR